LSWINKTGTTQLGLREGHDIENSAMNVATYNITTFYTSDKIGTAQDPYLEVVYTTPVFTYQCSDGIDNDSDDLFDYPADLGCTSATDNDEYNASTDTTPPTGSIFINNNSQFTNNQNVSLSLSAQDQSGVAEMNIANDNNFSLALIEAFTTVKPWALSANDGLKIVYAWFKDTLGNWNSVPYSATITLDTVFPQITNIQTTNITPNTAKITWDTNENAYSDVEYGLTAGYGQILDLGSSLNTTHTANLSSLSANTVYHYRLSSIDQAGNTTNSIDYTFTTSQSAIPDTFPPADISDLSPLNISQISVELKWTSIGDDGIQGIAAQYDIRFSTSPITAANWDSASQLSGEPIPIAAGISQSFYIAVGLSPNTAYYFAIKAADEVPNWSNISNVIQITTLANTVNNGGGGGGGGGGGTYTDKTPPSQPANFIALPADGQIELNWVNPADADFVRVIITRKEESAPASISDGLVVYEGNGKKYTDINLINSVVYYYGISAYDKSPNYSNLLVISASPKQGQTTIEKKDNTVDSCSAYSQFIHLYNKDKNEVENVSQCEADSAYGYNKHVQLDNAGVELYKKITDNRISILNDQGKYALAYFINFGTPTTKRLGAGERAGVINSYYYAFNRLPKSVSDWRDVIKIANGRWPSDKSQSAEDKAKTDIFKAVYLRAPDMANANDNAAVTIIAYGLRPVNRNLDSEKTAIITFKNIYKHNPASASEWDITRAIAYSGAKR